MNASTPLVFGLFGTGGCARSIMPFAKAVAEQSGAGKIVFVETAPQSTEVNGVPVLSEEAFLSLPAEKKFFNIGIADSKARQSLAERCLAKGCIPLSLQAPDVLIYDNNTVGEGAILCARTMITSNVKIGKFFHANIFSYIEHDCVIGDYVTFAPRVNCNGTVHIGNHAYIGTGAVIKQGRSGAPLIIGEGAVIGMGAVVTKDVAPHTTVVGNPAHALEK